MDPSRFKGLMSRAPVTARDAARTPCGADRAPNLGAQLRAFSN